MKWTAGFLLVRLQPGEWRRALVLPLPLFVFEDALEAVASLVRIALWFGWRLPPKMQQVVSRRRLARIAELPAVFLRELRAHGPLVLAEVRDGRTHVSVRIV